jgi:hypothetical protein
LARRFIAVEFDPRTENPEARSFKIDIRKEVMQRRSELLAALLTIWRWGRLATDIKEGLTLGSFEQWCRWVRDPLLTLGCQDPVERVRETKQRDTSRQTVVELFNVWWERHGDRPVRISELHLDVQNAGDLQPRQFVSSYLGKLAGTRMAGFVLCDMNQSELGDGLLTRSRRRSHRGHGDHRFGCVDDPYDPCAFSYCTADAIGRLQGGRKLMTSSKKSLSQPQIEALLEGVHHHLYDQRQVGSIPRL